MWNADQQELVTLSANKINVEPAKLFAFMEVEAGNQAFANVNGKLLPLIRWEGHYFYRLLSGQKRQQAVKEGFAASKAGAVKNPRSQTQRYALLNEAKSIDEGAAISSCSWGIGQVMGDHWSWLDFTSPQAFEKRACSGFDGQFDIMLRFLEKSGIIPHLRRGDWSAVARIYNGPAYRKNKYDQKMADAYRRLSGGEASPSSSGMLRAGSKGARVREVQALLRRAGYAVEIDGDYGPATQRAVKDFQRIVGIEVDGVIGPETMHHLTTFKTEPKEVPGQLPVNKVEEVDKAAKTLGPVAVFIAFRDSLAELATEVLGLGVEWSEPISNGLTAASGLLGVGIALYGVYGWWKSRQTYEGAN